MARDADLAENEAFKKIKKLLGNPKAFAKPAGSKTSFPDFGFTIFIDRQPVDVHFEFKANDKAQMGSMRDWRFDGQKFYTPKIDADKETLIAAMNSSQSCVENAKLMLNDMQKYGDKRIQELHSGSFAVESNTELCRTNIKNFINNRGSRGYTIARTSDQSLSVSIVNHYKKKFKDKIRSGAKASILLLVIGKKVYFIDRVGSQDNDLNIIGDLICTDSIPTISSLPTALEVRISPQNKNKPNSSTIDVMANLRLSGTMPSGANLK